MNLDELAPAIAKGDAEAFATFLARVEDPIRRSLKPFAVRVDVEAILQEAFLRIWQVAPRFVSDGRENGLFRLALRVARNLALDDLKRRREEPIDPAGEVATQAALEPVSVDPLLAARIAECFDELPEKPRQAMSARLENDGGDPDSVLAERCRMKPNTFFQNVTRARRLLASCLDAHGIPPPPHHRGWGERARAR